MDWKNIDSQTRKHVTIAVLARCCKQMRRLRIEVAADYVEREDRDGIVTQTGLIDISQGCPKLEYMYVHVYDITNAVLRIIGAYLKILCDFHLTLLCQERFALYKIPGGLTDAGLRYIGQHSPNVRWILLGNVSVTNEGLLEFSNGCPMLQKLEIRV